MDAMAGMDQPGTPPILHACAAGNENTDTDANPHYPSSYNLDNIIAIAATDRNDFYASFSRYGATSVDVAAPGVSIISTYIPGNAYTSLSCTSMATPHVAGTAALVWSTDTTQSATSFSAAQVKARILSGADPLSDLSKPTLISGRLNAFNSLESDAVPPAAVSDLAVSGSSLTSIDLSWTAVGDDGLVGTASSYDLRSSTSPITTATSVLRPRSRGSRHLSRRVRVRALP